MNITVEDSKLNNIQVGDIIEYGKSGLHRDHGFYMICQSEAEGYFVMSLTGKKGALKYYSSLKALIGRQSNIKNVFTKEEYEIKLIKK